MGWHYYDEYDVYVSRREGVVEVRQHDTQEPAPDDIADLIAWAVGIGHQYGREQEREVVAEYIDKMPEMPVWTPLMAATIRKGQHL